MTPVDLLQQVGLSKYEAEAYYALLATGPLTGYEVGKRSQVPLSRSYEILERLAHRGLALQQPGDPPRYAAEEPGRFLGQVQATLSRTLDALGPALAALERPDTTHEFWVLRGRRQILARVQALIGGAQRTIDLSLPAAYRDGLADPLNAAQARGCRIHEAPAAREPTRQIVWLLIDEREALVGMLSPEEHCQAVTSASPALAAALHGHFAASAASAAPVTPRDESSGDLGWVDWETRKQQRLWRLSTSGQVA